MIIELISTVRTAIQETIRRQQNALLFLANQIAHVHSQVEDALKAFVEFAKKYQVEEMLRVSDQLSVNLKGINYFVVLIAGYKACSCHGLTHIGVY